MFLYKTLERLKSLFECCRHDRLELLSEDEVEVTAALLAEYLVEAIRPVDTHHADHRQKDTHTRTGASLHAERIELLDRSPCVTALDKGQGIDRR